ncbi:hypothetical protein PEP31012_02200 [Pandoraea eparura]|uniref:Uncharacterized protein n=1 Tax=Pandoraea eparura TaxID=2508291 RepID=A0A5E4UW25_9BURK|nr:hypothetical protein PEP31012_02200 [Pandoraea eparura]
MDRLNFVKRGILSEELVKQRDLVEIVFLALTARTKSVPKGIAFLGLPPIS